LINLVTFSSKKITNKTDPSTLRLKDHSLKLFSISGEWLGSVRPRLSLW